MQSKVPRLGIGTIGYQEEPPWITLALLAALRNENIHVQIFVGRGAYPRYAIARGVCGRCLRYLDSWLMTPELCREFFLRGMKSADIGIVEGVYFDGGASGGLDTLCEWLDLPQLVIVDASRVDCCRDLQLPRHVAGIFIDRVENEKHFWSLRTDLELLYGVPVLGGLPRLSDLRTQFFQHLEGGCLPRAWWNSLGQQFARWWSKSEILHLARLRAWPFAPAGDGSKPGCGANRHASCGNVREHVGQVALAYDKAFNRYFCETLDSLESAGVKIVDFSPLNDESLPEGTDIVYIGCGSLGPYLPQLAANHCMKAALRKHLAMGRAVYAEGAGAAYLCQEICTPQGQSYPMVGLLPAVANWVEAAREPSRTECITREGSWLFAPETRLRGYRTHEWELRLLRPEAALASDDLQGPAVVGCYHAVGSLLHINFAWQPVLLERFIRPRVATKLSYDPWQPPPASSA